MRDLGYALLRGETIILFRDRHADRLGEFAHGLGECEARVLDEKADCCAVRLATETVIELLGRTDGERRRLLVMKRAQAGEVGARLPQFDITPDHLDQIDAV